MKQFCQILCGKCIFCYLELSDVTSFYKVHPLWYLDLYGVAFFEAIGGVINGGR